MNSLRLRRFSPPNSVESHGRHIFYFLEEPSALNQWLYMLAAVAFSNPNFVRNLLLSSAVSTLSPPSPTRTRISGSPLLVVFVDHNLLEEATAQDNLRFPSRLAHLGDKICR